jgi:organic hydroperoxide reductase OsmC/OhrA
MHIEAEIKWERSPDEEFLNGHYQRTHRWLFDGGATVQISSSPHVVAEPFSNPALADPEEIFIAAISSCHMLFFLSMASRRKLVVDSYTDCPLAVLEKDPTGRVGIQRLTLRPKVSFADPRNPGRDVIRAIHDQAHASCFLANSVKTEINIQSDIQ